MNMSFHYVAHMNPWALLVSTLFLWMLGACWYSPALFVKPWIAALGISPHGPKKGLAAGMVSSLIGDFFAAFVLLHFILWSGAGTWLQGGFIGFLCWLGFFAATTFPQGIYERRPTSLFLINAGYWLVGLMVAGGILAVWK